MEKVISVLFDIEKKANQIIEHANIEKDQLFEENEKAIAKMEAEIMDENTKKINKIISQAEKKLEAEKKHLIENSSKQLKDLEAHYIKDHDELVNKLFQSIIKI